MNLNIHIFPGNAEFQEIQKVLRNFLHFMNKLTEWEKKIKETSF
jgi:hypothetical protein